MNLLEHTFYINLEERTDRREHVEEEFKKLGVTAERFPAIKDMIGSIGCTLSHIKVLELAQSRNYPNVFICEDDITFLNPTLLTENLERFISSADGLDWDVIIICGNNSVPYEKISDFHIRIHNCLTTGGYIVNQRYYDTLIQNFRESVSNLLLYPFSPELFAIDVYWITLQQKDKWYMIVPVNSVQYPSYSNIENKHVNYVNVMLKLDDH
jgi:glycosyl transferase family 25